ncbi:MAG: adenylate/guanylate cyclase domain-containing protein [Hyphomicrobiaceae bacterium]|nr:adenylate/guanylate cyclase domain-containing protein [Hyphomicrobiaceae bacterium]
MGSRTIYAGAVLILLALIVIVRIADPVPIARLRLLGFDTFQLLAPRDYDPGLPVRIVDIDDKSLEEVGQWPWPRSILAELTRKLADSGAAVVGYDIIMAEPDRPVADAIRRLPRNAAVDQVLAMVEQLPSGDEALAAAIGGAPVVLGFIGADRDGAAPVERAGFAYAGDPPGQFVPGFRGAVASLPVLQERAKGSGSLNWVPEHDQIIRRLPLLVRIGATVYPSLAAEAVRVAQGASTFVVKASGASGEEAFGSKTGVVALRAGALEIPTDGNGQVWIQFTRTDPRRFISAVDLLEGKVDRSEIEGRIILIGTSAAGLFDLRTTPLDPAVPGVEVHAQAIEQIVLGTHLRRPDFATGAELFVLVVFGGLLAAAVHATGALLSAFVGAAALAISVGSSWAAYRGFGWLLDPVYPGIALTFLYISTTVYLYLRTERERRRVRNAFSHYMAPALVAELAADPSKLKLGGEMREVTLMFCDVRGFTALSEKLDAEQVTRFLNRLLTPLSDEIMAGRGTIDKYMGDGIMAFWNAPLDDPDHALNACRSALAMLAELERLNREWAAEAAAEGRAHEPVRIGIGINTAVCCVGNLGSEHRFDYSVVGDGVNIAARLEGRSKTYGVPIVVGEATARRAPQLGFVELDFVSVHGRSEALHVFGLLGDAGRVSDAAAGELRGRHKAVLEAFRRGRFDEAGALLVEARAAAGGKLSALYDLYEARVAEYKAHPPPPGWDGRTLAESK